jgi:hypothetical protein
MSDTGTRHNDYAKWLRAPFYIFGPERWGLWPKRADWLIYRAARWLSLRSDARVGAQMRQRIADDLRFDSEDRDRSSDAAAPPPIDLDAFELWYPSADGSKPLRNALMEIREVPSGKHLIHATRLVWEITPGGLPLVVGLEILDRDESGQCRRNPDGSGKVLAYGTLPDKHLIQERLKARAEDLRRSNQAWLYAQSDEERVLWEMCEDGNLVSATPRARQTVEAL